MCFAENIINTTILPILILQWFPTWKKKKTIKTKPFVVNFPTAYYFLGYASPSWEASTDNKCWHLSCHVSLLSFLRQKKSINSARQSIEVWFCSLHSGGPPTTQGSNKFTGKETGKSHICTVQSCKGQLISERNFGVFKSPNKRTNVASVLPSHFSGLFLTVYRL